MVRVLIKRKEKGSKNRQDLQEFVVDFVKAWYLRGTWVQKAYDSFTHVPNKFNSAWNWTNNWKFEFLDVCFWIYFRSLIWNDINEFFSFKGQFRVVLSKVMCRFARYQLRLAGFLHRFGKFFLTSWSSHRLFYLKIDFATKKLNTSPSGQPFR